MPISSVIKRDGQAETYGALLVDCWFFPSCTEADLGGCVDMVDDSGFRFVRYRAVWVGHNSSNNVNQKDTTTS